MKSVMIAAALATALIASVPVTAQAATSKMTDMQIYCMFMPIAKDCMKPAAKPAPKTAMHLMKHMAKPAPKMVMAKATGIKLLVCTKRTDGKPFLLSCAWK